MSKPPLWQVVIVGAFYLVFCVCTYGLGLLGVTAFDAWASGEEWDYAANDGLWG